MVSEQQDSAELQALEPKMDTGQPTIFRIRIKSHLGSEWTEWFEGLTVTQEENGDTLLTGLVVDQAALYGLLKKVRDLGMPLVSVNPVHAPALPLKAGSETGMQIPPE